MTSVKDGAFYGWPYSYYGQHVDIRIGPQRPDLVAKAILPDHPLGASLNSRFRNQLELRTLNERQQLEEEFHERRQPTAFIHFGIRA